MSSVGAAKVTPESRKLKEKDMRREEIAQDHVSIQKAERFILQVYYIVDKNIAMMSLLDYEPALEKFNEYIAFEASNCAFTMQFWHALRHLEHQRTDEAMFKLAKNLSNCFFCEPGDGNRVLVSNFAKQSVLNATKKDVLVVKEVLAAFRLTHTELIAFLANLYTKFLQSKYYTSWRCQERGHAAGLALQYVLKYSDIPVGGTPEKRNPKLPTGSIKRGLIPPLKTQLVELEKVTKSGKNNSLVVRPALKVQVENNISSTESANNKLPVSASPGGDQFPTDFPSYSNPNHSSGCSDSSNSGVSVGTGKISQQKDGETVTNRIRHMTSVVPDEENDHSWTLKSVYFLPKTEDLANTAFHSMDLGKLSKLIACESRWLIILLAGLENLPLSFSLHSATTATLTPAGGRKGITVQFPYIYANRFHEKMADVHRKLLKNKPMHALFDNFSEIEKLIKARLVTSLAENPKGTLAKTGSFIGLLGSKVNTLSADITPPTSLSKKFTSVKVNHSRFFKPKPLKFEPSTAAEIITFYDNILAGNPSVMFARVRSQGNKAFARKVMSVSSSAGGDSASQQQSSASAPGSSSASPCVSAFSESTAADDESPFVHEAHEFGSVKSIVFGVKPVFNADKSVIYFLTIQFVVSINMLCLSCMYCVVWVLTDKLLLRFMKFDYIRSDEMYVCSSSFNFVGDVGYK